MKKKYSNLGSDRSFGVIFAIIFFIISFWPVFSGEALRIWSILVAIILLLISYLKPHILHPLNKIWFKFGLLLGAIIAPIIMGIIYFIVLTPTGLIMRLIGKDLLNKKINKSVKSYWIKRERMIGTMKNQY